MLPELVRSHVSVQGASDPRPAPAAVVAVVPVEAAALPGLAVPPLHLLVDEIFEVLLPFQPLFCPTVVHQAQNLFFFVIN